MASTRTIIHFMQELGYPANHEGVCYGLAIMAERARACNCYHEFEARMDFLNKLKQLPEGQLADLIAQAEKHNRALQKNKTSKPLTEKEKILLTIKTFFFQVSVYQNPHILQNFFDIKASALHQNDISKIDTLLDEEHSENDQTNNDKKSTLLGESKNYLLSSMQKDNDHQFLKSFLETIQISGIRTGLLISNSLHTIHLFYDEEKSCWHLTNHSRLNSYDKFDNLLLELWRIFAGKKVFHLDIRVFLPKENQQSLLLKNRLTEISKSAVDRLWTLNINATNRNGVTLLLLAAQNGHLEVVKALLAAKANINAACKDGYTPLFIAAQNGQLDIVEALLAANAKINAAHTSDATPLFIAAKKGYLELIKALLDAGANVNAARTNGATPLFIAAQNGHFHVVKALLAANANINATLTNGATPLYIANKKGHREIALAIKKCSLLDYSKKINDQQDSHFGRSLTIFGHIINLGYSAEANKAAADALESVVFRMEDKSCLKDHLGALNNGELGSIYRSFNI